MTDNILCKSCTHLMRTKIRHSQDAPKIRIVCLKYDSTFIGLTLGNLEGCGTGKDSEYYRVVECNQYKEKGE